LTRQPAAKPTKTGFVPSYDDGEVRDDHNPPEYAAPTDLEECYSCGRKFNPKAMEKHEKICQKVFVEKRK
jgi:hypothetical protein